MMKQMELFARSGIMKQEIYYSDYLTFSMWQEAHKATGDRMKHYWYSLSEKLRKNFLDMNRKHFNLTKKWKFFNGGVCNKF